MGLIQTTLTTLTLRDKNGKEIYENDILFDGKYYHRISLNHLKEFEMICVQLGYTNEVQPKDLVGFERIGPYQEFEHLLVSD